ncbi:efflux RND transporter permease subunit [Pseudomonas aeruginosa]
MRVWLGSNKVASRNLTATDVVGRHREQNRQVAAGTLGAPLARAHQHSCRSTPRNRLVTEESSSIIGIRAGASSEITRLRDIARVRAGLQPVRPAFAASEQQAGGGDPDLPASGSNAIGNLPTWCGRRWPS